MAVLSLPLSFNNSFWTHEYRNGLEVLYNKLEQVRVPPHVWLLQYYTHITEHN
jgi:hypothetical protein